MEVGEYIRTIEGYIRKIDNINIEKQKITYYGKYVLDIPYKNSQAVAEKKIKSHSKDIIDLIEVGDYVNGMRVIVTENRGRYNEEKQKDEKVILAENYDEWTENGVISNEDIKTILTHEMYEQNCYKVGVD